MLNASESILTPKRKDRNSSSSSPEEKRLKEYYSPPKTSNDGDEVMEDLVVKIDLVLTKLSNLETKMEELNTTVKGLQSKVTSLEDQVRSVKAKQKTLNDNFTEMEKNSEFVDEQLKELKSKTDKTKDDGDNTCKKLLYLEAYSRRENLKFEGIPETPKLIGQQGNEDRFFQQNIAPTEDTKAVLTGFMKEILGIEDATNIEFQRVHRMGKPKEESGKGRVIIARFLRFTDRERVLKCGRKLKDTEFKMYEDLPKDLHDLRKPQIERLKKARKDGKRAYFSKSEPDKLYIDGKYVKT